MCRLSKQKLCINSEPETSMVNMNASENIVRLCLVIVVATLAITGCSDKQADPSGMGVYTAGSVEPTIVSGTAVLEYSIGLDAHTLVELLDHSGLLVRTLLDEYQTEGTYSITIDASDLSNGMYFCRITSGEWTSTSQFFVLQ